MPGPSSAGVVSLRIAARAPDLATFVRRFGPHLHGDHFFIATRSPRPVGTTVRFMLEIQDGQPILQGEGKVVRVETEGTVGMEVVFVPLDERSRTVLSLIERDRASHAHRPAPVRASPPKPPPLPASLRRPQQQGSAATPLPAPVPAPPEPSVSAALPEAPLPEGTTAPTVVDAAPGVVTPVAETPTSEVTLPDRVPPIDEPFDQRVPANPFGELSNGDLEYFVDWSVDHVSAEHDAAEREPALYAEVTAPAPRRRWAPAAYLLSGVLIGGVGVSAFTSSRSRPSVAVAQPRPTETRAPAPVESHPPPSAPPVAAPAPPVAAAPAPPSASPVAAAAAPPSPPPAASPEPPATAESFTVEVRSEPSGASVVVDGRAAGHTPLHLTLERGSHEVRASHARYAEAVRAVDAPGVVAVKLERPRATLDVESTPAGAEVKVRGKPSGQTPLHLELAAFKSYDIEVVQAGKAWKKKVYLKPPSTTLVATLAR